MGEEMDESTKKTTYLATVLRRFKHLLQIKETSHIPEPKKKRHIQSDKSSDGLTDGKALI